MGSGRGGKPIDDVTVFTSKLFELNIHAQDTVRAFALHDFDDIDGLEKKRIAMHDAFTELYDKIAHFSEEVMGEDFDIAYLRERIMQTQGEEKAQLA